MSAAAVSGAAADSNPVSLFRGQSWAAAVSSPACSAAAAEKVGRGGQDYGREKRRGSSPAKRKSKTSRRRVIWVHSCVRKDKHQRKKLLHHLHVWQSALRNRDDRSFRGWYSCSQSDRNWSVVFTIWSIKSAVWFRQRLGSPNLSCSVNSIWTPAALEWPDPEESLSSPYCNPAGEIMPSVLPKNAHSVSLLTTELTCSRKITIVTFIIKVFIWTQIKTFFWL